MIYRFVTFPVFPHISKLAKSPSDFFIELHLNLGVLISSRKTCPFNIKFSVLKRPPELFETQIFAYATYLPIALNRWFEILKSKC